MPKDNRIIKYGSVYIPEEKPKSSAKRGEVKDSGRMQEMEDAIRALQDVLAKNNRDNLDAMYNIDTDNLSSSFRRLLSSYDDGITKAQADIQTWANAQEAGFSAVAEWQDETSSSIAAIQGKADANAASITSITKWQSGVNSSIAQVEQKADANSASITSITKWQSGVNSSIAAVQTKASQNEAKITSITSWQGGIEDDVEGLISSVAVIEQVADENGASISQIVSAVGDDGEVTAASIVAAVNDSGSRVMINADKIEMTGDVTFLTAEDVGDDGTTEIAGNRISILIDGTEDDGQTDIESYNGLHFDYKKSYESPAGMAKIGTSVDGSDTDITSRYAFDIKTYGFYNENGDFVKTALKLSALGRASLEAAGVYIEASSTDAGTINLRALFNTRIGSYLSYSQIEELVDRGYTGATYTSGYCFCTDGIYYDGELMLATP